MKKNLLVVAMVFSSAFFCYPQSATNRKIDAGQINTELLDSIDRLNKEIDKIREKQALLDSSFNSKLMSLSLTIDSTKNNIDDSRLKATLKSADSTIAHLDSFINSFAVIYGIISIIIVLLTIGLPLLIQQLSIVPMKKEFESDHNKLNTELERILELKIRLREQQIDLEQKVDNSLQHFNNEKTIMFENVSKEFDSKFQKYLSKNKKEQIDQALINLTSDQTDFVINACSFISHTPIGDFTDDQLFKITQTLKKQSLTRDRSEMLVYKISEKKCDYTDEFFDFLPSLNKINTINTRSASYHYFVENGISNYKDSFIKLIFSAEDPTSEYIKVLNFWRSYDEPQNILTILNFEELQTKEKIDLDKVYHELHGFYFFSEHEQQIKQSQFYNALNKP